MASITPFGYKERSYIDTLLSYILWFFKRFWCSKRFWPNFCHKKAGHLKSMLYSSMESQNNFWFKIPTLLIHPLIRLLFSVASLDFCHLLLRNYELASSERKHTNSNLFHSHQFFKLIIVSRLLDRQILNSSIKIPKTFLLW